MLHGGVDIFALVINFMNVAQVPMHITMGYYGVD